MCGGVLLSLLSGWVADIPYLLGWRSRQWCLQRMMDDMIQEDE